MAQYIPRVASWTATDVRFFWDLNQTMVGGRWPWNFEMQGFFHFSYRFTQNHLVLTPSSSLLQMLIPSSFSVFLGGRDDQICLFGGFAPLPFTTQGVLLSPLKW